MTGKHRKGKFVLTILLSILAIPCNRHIRTFEGIRPQNVSEMEGRA